MRYGMLLKDTAMTVVNIIGLVFQATYTVLFFYYATNKAQFRKQMVMIVSLISATWLYVHYEPAAETSQFRLGLLCCSTTLIFCAAPLSSLVSNRLKIPSPTFFSCDFDAHFCRYSRETS